MPLLPNIILRPTMRHTALLRKENNALMAENARLHAERAVFTDFEGGELKLFREANDSLVATNLRLEKERDTLAAQLKSLGGVAVIEEVREMRNALAQANQRAMEMDFAMAIKTSELETARNEMTRLRKEVDSFRKLCSEMARRRRPDDGVFYDFTHLLNTPSRPTPIPNKDSHDHIIVGKAPTFKLTTKPEPPKQRQRKPLATSTPRSTSSSPPDGPDYRSTHLEAPPSAPQPFFLTFNKAAEANARHL
ncbi:hypothetical protein CC85DRAFT_302661 [Cutaneotrichosporon oleaginosum]|uniref:Uncharacterized protein n=1 Tax=Cutaneotrichosporon oleaginosum TaxID=879819 RepID=A0A0J0XLY1_9TREE|nr:uncharacterized protein CC85DRAFT_302661 [Cutaneotrichosporon oleaginosum]KLT42110.1 hypothetical protein CC85DRAFT_302661 [Cutaneotrichosporon oleaginosum]TXT04651.1 hypothetical protein COLE_07470 [Cutaneotrichosporon oleaginosum]